MPKWLMIKLMKTTLIAFRIGNGAVTFYKEVVHPIGIAAVFIIAGKVTYDEWRGDSIYAKSEEVAVDDDKRAGGKARRTDNSKAYRRGNYTP